MQLHTCPIDPAAVEAFVAAHPDRAQGHRPVWLTVLREGLGHRPAPISAWRDRQIVGWLPMVVSRSLLFGRRVVSLPYVNEAGVLAEDDAVAEALLERASQVARKTSAGSIELRHRQPLGMDRLTPIRRDKVGMTLALADGADRMWDAIPSKVRNLVRKAEKQDVTCRVGGVELLDAFFAVFAQNMRDLGTPVLPRKLFRAILHHFQDDAELVIAERDGQVMAAGLLVHSHGVTEVPSASSLRQFNFTNANMALYWAMLKRAAERGSATFDFGRSTIDSGPHRFKKQWGAAPHELGWQSCALGRDVASASREEDRFALAIRIWRRLPVCVTRGIGPSIARCLC